MAEVDEARIASGGARRSSSAKISRLSRPPRVRSPARDRRRERPRRASTAERAAPLRRRVGGEAVRGKLVKPLPDQSRSAASCVGARIGDAHVPAGAGEDDGPGPADQAGSDDGDSRHSRLPSALPGRMRMRTRTHDWVPRAGWRAVLGLRPAMARNRECRHSHSTLRRRARSSRRAFDGPEWITRPRSSATVRSDSASARSRW